MKKIEKIDILEAARYLGIKQDVLDDTTKKLLEECGAELLKSAKPKYIYRIFKIENTDDEILLSGTNFKLLGEDIKAHLKGCHSVALMAATLSSGADNLIKIGAVSDITKAVMYDALASALIEQVCDNCQEEIKSICDGNLTSRYSAGYGDFPLDSQKDILTLLNTEKLIGLYVSDSSMLIPMKSVTAVIGISDDKSPKENRRGCENCNLKDNCNYRKRGVDCGL